MPTKPQAAKKTKKSRALPKNTSSNKQRTALSDHHAELLRLREARHHDPFTLLGWCDDISGRTHNRGYRVFRPYAKKVFIKANSRWRVMKKSTSSACFELAIDIEAAGKHPRIKIICHNNTEQELIDPYSFHFYLEEEDLNALSAEDNAKVYHQLGAHLVEHEGVSGVRFLVWAPNAERVSVVGDFCLWNGELYPMRNRGASGLWELFIPDLKSGELYKYEIRNRDSGEISCKSDPFARSYELPPRTSSIISLDTNFDWQDAQWMKNREHWDWLHSPTSIYELHLGSWRKPENSFPNYRDIAKELVHYVKQQGFTHIQLMPITEHPFDGSWGYQVIGYFAATCRYGSADDLRYLIDHCHRNHIGVILDWVPGHFPKDAHGLARYDGSALYEHEHPLRGEHQDWGTLIFNYDRPEVRNFLLSSADYWVREFHLDGLRVDAVASMLYLDYSRDEWLPNEFGGNENLEAISFLRSLNEIIHRDFPGVLVIAEESTAWPQVSRPTYVGGLGFSMKWNMGWMNDTLSYMQTPTVYRKYHQDKLTFSLLYAFSENFVLPFSHDEVVHGKGSILSKMPGDSWQQFANVRLLYTYQFTHPGKKLLFMGSEFAQGKEWDHDNALDWPLTEFPLQQGVQRTVADLNKLYSHEPSLHQHDFESNGFEWLDCNDTDQSTISYLRKSDHEFVIVVLNFTPEVRKHYRIGVPESGPYREIFNSDSLHYQGSNISNGTEIPSKAIEWMGRQQSIELTLPPLAGLIIKRCQG